MHFIHSISGGDERGLHGLCPAEILHCVRLGLFKMAVTCFYNYLQPRHRSELDKVVTILKNQFKHQSERCVPRTSFKFLISDLTKITASEWICLRLMAINWSTYNGITTYMGIYKYMCRSKKCTCIYVHMHIYSDYGIY